MIGVARPLILLALPLAAVASAREHRQDPEISELETRLIAVGEIEKRLTVPITVAGTGPYNFIIDTGSERTVVSSELAKSLALAPAGPVTLISITSRSLVDAVHVPALSIQSVGDNHSVIAPSLAAHDLGAIGLLGIDALQKHRVTIDFERRMMTVHPARRRTVWGRRPQVDEIVVNAKRYLGQLIVTDAYYGDTRIQVILDTGSQVTIGNSALRERIGNRIGKTYPIVLSSVTGEKSWAHYTLAPDIQIGQAHFDQMPVAFADVLAFERFGLAKRPALLVGMDALRSFRRVEIDFPNRQVRLTYPPGNTPALRGGPRTIEGPPVPRG